MALFDDLYKPFEQKNPLGVAPLPAAPVVAPVAPAVDPFQALIASLMTPKSVAPQQQIPWQQLLQAFSPPRDIVGEYNRLSSLPSDAPGSLSPFNTGFFNNRQGAQVGAYPAVVPRPPVPAAAITRPFVSPEEQARRNAFVGIY